MAFPLALTLEQRATPGRRSGRWAVSDGFLGKGVHTVKRTKKLLSKRNNRIYVTVEGNNNGNIALFSDHFILMWEGQFSSTPFPPIQLSPVRQ